MNTLEQKAIDAYNQKCKEEAEDEHKKHLRTLKHLQKKIPDLTLGNDGIFWYNGYAFKTTYYSYSHEYKYHTSLIPTNKDYNYCIISDLADIGEYILRREKDKKQQESRPRSWWARLIGRGF